MNELHRQLYLSALGMDSYMPRLHLPYAPLSKACESSLNAPTVSDNGSAIISGEQAKSYIDSVQLQKNLKTIDKDISPVSNLMIDIFEPKRVGKTVPQSIIQPVTAIDILAQFDSQLLTVEPFSLSIWRPFDNVMIIDSRNTKLALPTELLLNNILRLLFPNQLLKLQEDVLRWPMIENSFTKRTSNDARTELQTWLSVQHEIRPIQYLWLMGLNAATYLIPETHSYGESVNKVITLNDATINALVLPSLNEVLQKPLLKKNLFSVLRAYQSAH